LVRSAEQFSYSCWRLAPWQMLGTVVGCRIESIYIIVMQIFHRSR
jgi:hypothetical protein